MRTRELLQLQNTGHQGINALFSKAHSADWDIDRDVDWTSDRRDDPLVDPAWTAFGQTPTFQALPEAVKNYATRRGLGRMLNILQVGESVAQDVCAKIGAGGARGRLPQSRRRPGDGRSAPPPRVPAPHREDERVAGGHRSRHRDDVRCAARRRCAARADRHGAVLPRERRDGHLREHRPHARNPLLRDIMTLITRDESRHMGFGILYVAEWMRTHSLERRSPSRAAGSVRCSSPPPTSPGPSCSARLLRRLREAGVDDARRARAAAAARAAGDQRRGARRGRPAGASRS